jgi:hypothetical protein
MLENTLGFSIGKVKDNRDCHAVLNTDSPFENLSRSKAAPRLGNPTRRNRSRVMAAGRVVVYGGKGALGSVIVNYFKSKSWVK